MGLVLPAVPVVLLLAVCALCWKIHVMRQSARRIGEAFHERLTQDANPLIDIPSRDPALRALASEINDQLRLLRAQRQRYLQGDREVKEAMANLSHDLRTPLTAACGYLELLKRQDLSPDAARYLARIEERTQAMKALTEELFSYSLAVSERASDPRPLDLRRALEEALLSFCGAFAQKGVEPLLELAEQDSLFLLDSGALNRIFGNILSNALKYSAGDLRVTLDGEGHIAFSNPAPGLDAVAAGRLFDRYYTVEAAQGSAGLGLAIARKLTGEMGGRIGAEWSDGCLTVRLDVSAARLPPVPGPAVPPRKAESEGAAPPA